MTEADWLACLRPQEMLSWLQATKRRRRPTRKLGLFAVACAERVKLFMTEPVTLKGLELAERLAEGSAGEGEYHAYLAECQGQRSPHPAGARSWAWGVPIFAVQVPLPHCTGQAPDKAAVNVSNSCASAFAGPDPLGRYRELATQAELLRDIIGNPFQRSTLGRATPTSAIANLAEAAYEERHLPSGHLDNARLAVLSDALEEAGCTDEAVLAHLRSPGPHVIGCWALDLVLGKE